MHGARGVLAIRIGPGYSKNIHADASLRIRARAPLGVKSVLVVRFLISVVRGTRERARTHANL